VAYRPEAGKTQQDIEGNTRTLRRREGPNRWHSEKAGYGRHRMHSDQPESRPFNRSPAPRRGSLIAAQRWSVFRRARGQGAEVLASAPSRQQVTHGDWASFLKN